MLVLAIILIVVGIGLAVVVGGWAAADPLVRFGIAALIIAGVVLLIVALVPGDAHAATSSYGTGKLVASYGTGKLT